MRRCENDFVVAMEECAELTQALSKAMRFGLYNHHPDKPEETNARQMLTEYYQLQAMMERIIKRHDLHLSEDDIHIIKEKKLANVDRFLNISVEENIIDDIIN